VGSNEEKTETQPVNEKLQEQAILATYEHVAVDEQKVDVVYVPMVQVGGISGFSVSSINTDRIL
jgi:hypothetical protein